MSGLFGLEDLWATDENLRLFRKDRSRFIEAVQHWEATARVSIGEYAYEFRCPREEFRTFTDLLELAAEQLFGMKIPAMREFVHKCYYGAEVDPAEYPPRRHRPEWIATPPSAPSPRTLSSPSRWRTGHTMTIGRVGKTSMTAAPSRRIRTICAEPLMRSTASLTRC